MKICTFSIRSVGATFVDWSIHFLSGQTQYFSTKLNQYIPLTKNPLASIGNAHGHLRNHIGGVKKIRQYLDSCDPTIEMYSLYATPLKISEAFKEYGLDFNSENYDVAEKQRIIDSDKIFELCQERNIKIIFLTGDSNVPLYFLEPRTIDRFTFIDDLRPTSIQDIENEKDNFFFNKAVNIWKNNGLDNIWDIRERKALNWRPLKPLLDCTVTQPHLQIDCRELWTSGERSLQRILKYLNLDINQERFDQWMPIYNQWSQTHRKALEFVYNCDYIITAIINNWDFEIDLSFNEEIVIQHFLIYKYNLNFKTWQLDKFPNNTKKLHQLLVPNEHDIPKIY